MRPVYLGRLVALFFAALCISNAANAASLRAEGGSGNMRVGETRSVSLVLDLAPGEQASVFEGSLQLSGGEAANAELVAGSANWSSAVGRLSSGSIKLSLTSNNAAGSRVIGTLRLTGKQLGNLSLRLEGQSLLAEDTSTAPYTRNVSLSTPAGTTLASINVVSDGNGAAAPGLPASGVALLCTALAALGVSKLRKRARA
jgi:hypothetical protein